MYPGVDVQLYGNPRHFSGDYLVDQVSCTTTTTTGGGDCDWMLIATLQVKQEVLWDEYFTEYGRGKGMLQNRQQLHQLLSNGGVIEHLIGACLAFRHALPCAFISRNAFLIIAQQVSCGRNCRV